MSRFKLINLIDKLFVSVAIFLIIYAWINFYIRDLWTTFILSLFFSFSIVFLLYFFLNKKKDKTMKTLAKEKDIEENFLAFRLSSISEKMKLINNLLKTKYLTILRKTSLCYIKDNKKILVIFASYIDNLTQNEMINLLDLHSKEDIDGFNIICNQQKGVLSTDIYLNKTIMITTKKKLFELCCEANIYPNKSIINFKTNKLSIKHILQSMFEQKKSKAYFLYGLLLIFSSLILPFHAYYIVFGSMLLLFSIICKLLPKFTS